MTEDSHGAFSFPPGHFYSPIPSIDEIRLREGHIFDQWPHDIPEIDLNTQEQLNLLFAFRKYYKDFPFGFSKGGDLRFHLENPSYGHSDALILYCMLRHLKPKRIIEIGSGYSSCIMLDTIELFLENRVSCTFIEPYPQLLMSLIHEKDKERLEIIPRRLQDADVSIFSELSDSDILFIDSTHVSKIDSDVNHIFFRILPRLNRGVHVHFHDIFYPFEYPKDWVYQGLAWNEAYILRAFLEFNPAFRITFFNTYLAFFYTEQFFKELPFSLKYVGGSIWIQKVR